MTELSRSAVGLRFFGEDLDPDSLTASLGRAPTVGAKTGQSWTTSLGATKIARRGTWRLKAPDRAPADLDGQIMDLLSTLTTDLGVWQNLTAKYDADLFCGLFLAVENEGIGLAAKTLQEIANRNLKIDFDIYYEAE